jgi:hypothetical protein
MAGCGVITDDDLILYFYRDGLTEARRSEIAECLNTDAALSAHYCALVVELDQLGQVPEVPVPELAQARWRARLRQSAPAAVQVRSTLPMWALAAATLMLGIAIGVQLRRDDAAEGLAQVPITQAEDALSGRGALARGARLQLVRSDAQLAGWDGRTPDARRALVRDWLAQNRALARAAEAGGDAALARSLRALESTLADLLVVADASGDSANLREQLAFEWAVTQTKLATSPSKPVLQL